ncbi:MAG: oligosaccharide flippase family protein, partial [Gammaproteobacteria bacterium]
VANAGSEQYILQKETVNTSDINSAWTLDLCLKGGLWLVLFCSADLISGWFSEGNTALVIRVLSFILLIKALENPGLLLLKRNLDYTKIFWLELVFKVASFLAVILIALHYRSYWALIVGDLISVFVVTIGSYFICQHRPRIDGSQIKRQFAFSQWIILNTLVGFAKLQVDNFFVSSIFGNSGLGRYNMIKEIVLLPVGQLLQPITSPLLASLVSMRGNTEYLARQVRIILIVLMIMCSVIISYMVFFSEVIVFTLLGEQWVDSHKLMVHFSGLCLALSVGVVNTQNLILFGKIRFIFFYNLTFFILVVAIVVVVLSAIMAAPPFAVAYGVANLALPASSVFTLLITGALHCCGSGVVMVLLLCLLSRKVEEFQYLIEMLEHAFSVVKGKIVGNKHELE